MASRRQKKQAPTAEQWEQQRSLIERMYLGEDQPAWQIREHLERHDLFPGCSITDRQLKLRFRLWGYDDKKISGEVYYCMNRLLEHSHQDLQFKVPMLKGQKMKRKTAIEVRKEAKRRAKTDRKLKSEWDERFCNLVDVAALLRKHNVTWKPRTAGHDRDGAASDSDTEMTDSGSEGSETSIRYRTTVQPPNIDMPTSIPQLEKCRDPSALPDRSANTQRESTIFMAINSARLHRLGSEIADDMIPASRSVLHDEEDIGAKTALYINDPEIQCHEKELSQYLHDLDGVIDQYVSSSEKFANADRETTLQRIYNSLHSPECELHKTDASSFARYWIHSCLKRTFVPRVDRFWSEARRRSRETLSRMVSQENRLLLLAVRTAAGILMSHDMSSLLAALVLDYLWVMEKKENASNFTQMIKPAAYLSFFKLGSDTNDHRQILEKIGLELPLGFYEVAWHKKQLEANIELLSRQGLAETYEALYLKQEYSWLCSENGEPAQGLQMSLSGILWETESILGSHNPTTIYYLHVVARAYKQLGNIDMARNYLKTAIARLHPPKKIYEAIYFDTKFHLGRLELEEGNFQVAYDQFWPVLMYRNDEFLPNREILWFTVDCLEKTLHQVEPSQRQKFDEFIAELKNQRDRLWYQLDRPEDSLFYW